VQHEDKAGVLLGTVERVRGCPHDGAVLAAHETLMHGMARRVEQVPRTQPRGGIRVRLDVDTEAVKRALGSMGRVVVDTVACAAQCSIAAVPGCVGMNAMVEMVVEMR